MGSQFKPEAHADKNGLARARVDRARPAVARQFSGRGFAFRAGLRRFLVYETARRLLATAHRVASDVLDCPKDLWTKS